jgi:hypothetical protein
MGTNLLILGACVDNWFVDHGNRSIQLAIVSILLGRCPVPRFAAGDLWIVEQERVGGGRSVEGNVTTRETRARLRANRK